MKIVFKSTFHGTSATVITRDSNNNKLSEYQVKRVEKELCPSKNCACGTIWGNHVIVANIDGEMLIELLIENKMGVKARVIELSEMDVDYFSEKPEAPEVDES